MKLASLALLAALALLACAHPSDLKVHIWPQPQSIVNGSTMVFFNAQAFKFTLEKSSSDLEAAVKRYTALIFDHPSTKQSYPKETVPSCSISVENLDVPLQLSHDESYTLTVPADGTPCTLKAKTVYGVYQGLETLSQLVEFNFAQQAFVALAAPYTIVDKPQFSHRGILLDTARHYHPVPVIKRFIDSLTYAKFNVLHWHITDDESAPIESTVYPAFFDGAYTGYERYSLTDVKELVEYARLRGVRVMPEYDVPGHSRSWCVGVPEICPAPDCPNPLDPSKEATYEFLEKFLGEYTGKAPRKGIFPDDMIHLGGDEVDTSCWNKVKSVADWMKSKGFTTHDAYLHIVNRTQHIVMDQGREAVGWEEIWEDFGKKLDPRTIIHIWKHHDNVAAVVKDGYRVIVSNSDKWYLDWEGNHWDVMYQNDPLQGVPEDKKHLVIGGQGCMWNERVDSSVLFNTVWPRAAAISERLWSKPEDLSNLELARQRLRWFRCLLNRRGVNAHPVDTNARTAPAGPGGCFDN